MLSNHITCVRYSTEDLVYVRQSGTTFAVTSIKAANSICKACVAYLEREAFPYLFIPILMWFSLVLERNIIIQQRVIICYLYFLRNIKLIMGELNLFWNKIMFLWNSPKVTSLSIPTKAPDIRKNDKSPGF